ncbi:MAG TPA: potassium/proton antiporter [Thermoanaerobaculia bacterium]|nr:potassium/proton antiporter [Thermoanaerobaculia bacterium]
MSPLEPLSPPVEPTATAWLLAIAAVLIVASALSSRLTARSGIPLFLVFIALGIVAGSEGIGGIEFDDYHLSFRLGTIALALILFDGGLNSRLSAMRQAAAPATVLATVGVAGTAALVALGAWTLDFSWAGALLLGAVVSSTDAAAVFSVLRGGGLRLRQRVGQTLELESGLNDAMAVILTATMTEVIASGQPPGFRLLVDIPLQLAVGAAGGIGIGYGGRWLLGRVRLPAGGLYAVITLALAFLAFGLPTLLLGSGFLAVYLAGAVLGSGPLPYRGGLLRFHDSIAWLSQVTMFLVLGLLVFPSRLVEVAGIGILLALMLVLVARPLVVTLCLLPFGFAASEVLYLAWVGLRGAVPIILATVPVLAGVGGSDRLFHLVFFVVVISGLVPGSTVIWASRKLGLISKQPPPPPAVLEVSALRPLAGEILSFTVQPALPVCGVALAELPLPDKVVVMLILRGDELVGPRGATRLLAGDHVYVFSPPEEIGFVTLLFGANQMD